jgi:hypothetical protein
LRGQAAFEQPLADSSRGIERLRITDSTPVGALSLGQTGSIRRRIDSFSVTSLFLAKMISA